MEWSLVRGVSQERDHCKWDGGPLEHTCIHGRVSNKGEGRYDSQDEHSMGIQTIAESFFNEKKKKFGIIIFERP